MATGSIHGSAVSVAREGADKMALSATLRSLGGTYFLSGHADRALAHLEESLTISSDLGDREGAARTHNSLGLVYQSQGQQEKARSQSPLSRGAPSLAV